MKQAFTLIELLVVVLIIGILSAVAVPQYQKAVEKSRGAEALIVLRAIVDAQERYFLVNSYYTADLSDLDIDAPAETSFFRYYCDGAQSCFAQPLKETYYYFWFVMQNRMEEDIASNIEGKHWCIAPDGNERGKKFCKNFGTQDLNDRYYLLN